MGARGGARGARRDRGGVRVSEFGPEAFRGADLAIVVGAARALEEAGKAVYIKGEGGGDDGIKFF